MKQLFILLSVIFFGLLFDNLNIFLYCIIASLIHEAGHAAMYTFYCKKLPTIKFSVYGFAMQNNVTSKKQMLAILTSGPLVNILAALFSYILISRCFTLRLYVFMAVNALVAAVNLMPVYYMDGGQIFSIIFPKYNKYYDIISIISVLFMIVIAFCFTDNIHSTIVFLSIFITYFLINLLKVI